MTMGTKGLRQLRRDLGSGLRFWGLGARPRPWGLGGRPQHPPPGECFPLCAVCAGGVLQRACPFRCGRATSPLVLHAAAIWILCWVRGQPPAAGFCLAVAEKKPAHTGSAWPGSLGVGQGCRNLHPREVRWPTVSWFPSWASFLWGHESLWVGGGHPVPLRPGASPQAPEGGVGCWELGPRHTWGGHLEEGVSGQRSVGGRFRLPSHPVLPVPVCLTVLLL